METLDSASDYSSINPVVYVEDGTYTEGLTMKEGVKYVLPFVCFNSSVLIVMIILQFECPEELWR